MGERSQKEAGRCTIISDPVTCGGRDTQPCGHPVCFTDQRTQSLLSSSVPLTQTRSTSPLTHTHTQAHTLPSPHTQTHTPSHTPHTLLTHSSLILTHPHILLTHLNTSLAYSSHSPQTNTLHTHIQLHTHTPSHTPHLHTYTHIYTHKHRAYRSEDTGNTGTQGQCSHTRHVEPVGTAQSSRWGQSLDLPHTGSHWDPRSSLRTKVTVEGTQADPAQSRQNLTAL